PEPRLQPVQVEAHIPQQALGVDLFQPRSLDASRDLEQVADLIEVCFASHMDADGKEYLHQLRRLARDGAFIHRAVQVASPAHSPFSGFVWEEDGQIVGNLSLIPMSRQGQRIYLVANVAVRDDYRRRGIGRALTQAAIQKSRRLNADACWLQVRSDNPGAIDLYASLGFVERARRTTWLIQSRSASSRALNPEIFVTGRLPGDWPRQKAWLEQIYPKGLLWNMSFDLDRLKPGFWNALNHFLLVEDIRHWSVRSTKHVYGFATWQPSRSFADSIWLATDPENEDQAILHMLPTAYRSLNSTRPVSINYPAGRGEQAFRDAGFTAHNTLLWMELPFSQTRPIILR
ncbi:MAG TPA: GNAT family N-acetyltransferase, partial [Anaerolineaceae bacterium]|nr:GNAT family N-acetyltransferase [Anaerolineaceae bacterium]